MMSELSCMLHSIEPWTTPRRVAAWTPATIGSSIERVVRIVFLGEAQRRFEAEDEWWRENRAGEELFTDELEQTLERLAAYPEVGQTYRATRGKRIQRVLMKKTPVT